MSDLASSYLADVYAQMLANDFKGMGDMHCALELMAEHHHEMTTKQKRALMAFIEFWDALDDVEKETKVKRA
jgi:hypothetical protein